MFIRFRTRKLELPYTLNSKLRPPSQSSTRSRALSQSSLLLTVISAFLDWTTTPSWTLECDKEYLDSRRQALIVGEAERVKQWGLTMTFYPSPGQWRAVSAGDINILGIYFLECSHFTLFLHFQGKFPMTTWWWPLWVDLGWPSFGMWWRCSASYPRSNWCGTPWEGSREDCARTSHWLTRTGLRWALVWERLTIETSTERTGWI